MTASRAHVAIPWCLSSVLLAGFLWTLPLVACAHEEPPKTLTELADQRAEQRKMVAAGVREARLHQTRAGEPESLLLADTFDDQGRHAGQVVHDAARAQTSRSTYDESGDWVLEETWRDGQLIDRVHFRYDDQHLLVEVINEDLSGGVDERLVYDHATERDAIVVTKTRDGEVVYTIRYLYEPDGGRTQLVEAVKAGAEGELQMRTRQTWRDGLRGTKAVFGADDSLSYTFVYDHDTHGDLEVITRLDQAGEVVLRRVYAYGDDRLLSTVTDEDGQGRVTRVLRYEYDGRR